MKIAVASDGGAEGNAASHFAHCSHFVVFEVEGGKVGNAAAMENPYKEKHVPGAIPEYVKSLGASVLITGGIGPSAIQLFGKMGIEVICGARGKVSELVVDYLEGKLKADENSCAH
jgi:predicted Fe-Mo cluster-binding NifX family protein